VAGWCAISVENPVGVDRVACQQDPLCLLDHCPSSECSLALVYGNTGGATIGLDFVSRPPELVCTIVAHEPPLSELLPRLDCGCRRAARRESPHE
jgi:hypothetical protein